MMNVYNRLYSSNILKYCLSLFSKFCQSAWLLSVRGLLTHDSDGNNKGQTIS